MKRLQVNVLHTATSLTQRVAKALSNLHNSALASYGVQLSEKSATLRRALVDIANQKRVDHTNINNAHLAATLSLDKEYQRRRDLVDVVAFEAHEEVCSNLASINEEIERVVNARTDLI